MRHREHHHLGVTSKIFIVIFVALVVTTTIVASYYVSYYPFSYREIIDQELGRYDSLDRALILSIIKAESSFDPKAVSRVGACGLMQIMPSTYQEILDKSINQGIDLSSDIFDTRSNISAGIWYIQYLNSVFDSVPLAICAYNAGIGTVKYWQKIGIDIDDIPYKETSNYLQRVLSYYEVYSKLDSIFY